MPFILSRDSQQMSNEPTGQGQFPPLPWASGQPDYPPSSQYPVCNPPRSSLDLLFSFFASYFLSSPCCCSCCLQTQTPSPRIPHSLFRAQGPLDSLLLTCLLPVN